MISVSLSEAPAAPLRLAVTPGEPAGIGPELVASLACTPVAGCEMWVLADARLFGLTPSDAPQALKPGWWLVHHPLSSAVTPGVPSPDNAGYVLATLDTAIEGCQSGRFDAMVTGPLQKSTIAASGIEFSGHTEYLAQQCGGLRPVMLLTDGELHVALVTTHLPLRAVPDAITEASVLEALEILHHDLQARFGIARPRLLVCGLNPHAGEAGLLGHEDDAYILPAINRARAAGIEAVGPVPADTAFTPERLAGADAVLAMYHDQGLPVIKARGFGGIANVTLGLPIIRTSVDHGTALDLVGRGVASDSSLATAIDVARRLAPTARTRSMGQQTPTRTST